MKELVEKILERLNVLQDKAFNVKNEDVSMYAIGMMQKAKEIVQEVAEEYKENQILDAMKQRNDDIKDVINELREITRNGWIPVSDRLPKENGFYLATLDGEIAGEDKPFTSIAEFEDGKWVDDEDDYQCVLAWQKLPEPFKESDKNV